METPSFFLALIGGLLSFFSPCVLAVAPGYLALLAGTIPLEEPKSAGTQAFRGKAIKGTFYFIIGFTLIFVMMGTAFSTLGQILFQYRLIFLRVGGVMLIILGLFQWGFLKLFTLQREFRFHLKNKLTGPIGWLLTGASFAFGWTPCVGPILSMILIVAGSSKSVSVGMVLLLFYSLGMAIPFFLLAVAFPTFFSWYKRILPFTGIITFISGLLLIIIGILLFLDQFRIISVWMNNFFGNWSLEELFFKP